MRDRMLNILYPVAETVCSYGFIIDERCRPVKGFRLIGAPIGAQSRFCLQADLFRYISLSARAMDSVSEPAR